MEELTLPISNAPRIPRTYLANRGSFLARNALLYKVFRSLLCSLSPAFRLQVGSPDGDPRVLSRRRKDPRELRRFADCSQFRELMSRHGPMHYLLREPPSPRRASTQGLGSIVG